MQIKTWLLALALLSSPLYSLPVQNPADASLFLSHGCLSTDCFSWRLGYYGDFVFNRHLYATTGTNTLNVPSSNFGGSIAQTSISTNAGMLTLNFWERLELFATIGVTHMHIWANTDSLGFALLGTYSEYDFPHTMSYSCGARLTLLDLGSFLIGLEAQYFYMHPDLTWQMAYGQGSLTYLNNGSNYHEWQTALGASWIIETEGSTTFVPYLALDFSGVTWNFSTDFRLDNVPLVTPNIRADKLVGWALGLSILLDDLIGVTAEARFANEKALFISGQISF